MPAYSRTAAIAAQADPDLSEQLNARYTVPRRQLAVKLLEKAKDASHIRHDVDPETVVDQLWAACYHRLLLSAQPLTHDFVDRLLDNLIKGIKRRAG